MGGHPVAARRSSRRHLESASTPSGCKRCVDTVSLGKVARSIKRTRYPFRASNIAVGDPAQRAPTTIASNDFVIRGFSLFVAIRRCQACYAAHAAVHPGFEAPLIPWPRLLRGDPEPPYAASVSRLIWCELL